MNRLISAVEKTAGFFIGFLALITIGEAVLRYGFNSHIPDGFILGQTMQGIAICWGIATAAYADRHVSVDIVYVFAGEKLRRFLDITGYTITLLFMALFGYAMSFKTLDILRAGEISSELRIPIWTGYTLAALGIICAVLLCLLRWWQIVVLRDRPTEDTAHG